MSFVGVEAPLIDTVAAQLLASAVGLQAAIAAATPVATSNVPPGCEEVSALGAMSFNANNAEMLAMCQVHVAELVAAATEVGGAGIAFHVQDLVGKGLLVV